MTSRLTISAVVFSILATAGFVGVARAEAALSTAKPLRVVELERVTIISPRRLAKA